jgi:hypothetical protein
MLFRELFFFHFFCFLKKEDFLFLFFFLIESRGAMNDNNVERSSVVVRGV